MSKAIRKRFYGAIKSPRHRLADAMPHQILTVHPAQFGIVPAKLSAWGNDNYGDCVSAEEAFAKAISSVMAGVPEICPTDAEVIAFARKHGFLNGAELSEVMDVMASDGMSIGGKIYKDGAASTVNWRDRDNLCSALYQGPVKIGVSHGQIERAHSWTNGWVLTGARNDQSIDHCVVLCGYGQFGYLASLCSLALPAKLDAETFGYLLGTWSSIGLVDEASMRAVTGEAWLRTPTTPGLAPPEPQPNFPPPNCDPTPQPAPPSPAPTPDPRPCPRYRKLARHVLAIGSILTETDE